MKANVVHYRSYRDLRMVFSGSAFDSPASYPANITLFGYYKEPYKYRRIKEEKMAAKLKLYEKAGRVIRLMAWISGIGVLAIAAAVIIPLVAKPQQTQAGPIVVAVIVLALIALFVYFQLALGAAIKQHKAWGRTVGIGYAVILLFGFPIGTVIGAYCLYCLIKGWDQ